MKLISVIIPVWNRKCFLADVLESVRRQTYRPLEILVVDDGSTDGSRECLEKFAGKRTDGVSIRPFFRSHEGVSAARQFGLENAAGDFIQFLDSDDVLLPQKISKQVSLLEGSDAVCCLSRGYQGTFDSLLDASAGTFGYGDWRPIGGEIRSGEDALAVLADGVPFGIHAMMPLWRRDFLMEQAPWPREFCSGEDLVYFARVFRACEAMQLAFVDEPLVLLREHTGHRATVSPRLSGWGQIEESEQIVRRSAVLSRAEMVRELKKCKGWNRQWAAGCGRQLQTGYWDALHILNGSELRDYESLILALVPLCSRICAMIRLRRLFGSWMVVWFLRNYLSSRLRESSRGR
ncbi:MAG: glycosyltransferase family 2 protein [Kiritimatiellae bacterium]|nr:glycosyltransferase family 2 protein [Kiritimatiellia bacterium]